MGRCWLRRLCNRCWTVRECCWRRARPARWSCGGWNHLRACRAHRGRSLSRTAQRQAAFLDGTKWKPSDTAYELRAARAAVGQDCQHRQCGSVRYRRARGSGTSRRKLRQGARRQAWCGDPGNASNPVQALRSGRQGPRLSQGRSRWPSSRWGRSPSRAKLGSCVNVWSAMSSSGFWPGSVRGRVALKGDLRRYPTSTWTTSPMSLGEAARRSVPASQPDEAHRVSS